MRAASAEKRTQSEAEMAVTGAVTTYAFPPPEGSAYAAPRFPRSEEVLSRAPRPMRQAGSDRAGTATVLEFPARFPAQLDDDRAEFGASDPRARPNRPFSTVPTGAFLAQHIAQERLSEGLTLEPHAAAAAAYSRSRNLTGGANSSGVDLAV
jgi:hypothetical protein